MTLWKRFPPSLESWTKLRKSIHLYLVQINQLRRHTFSFNISSVAVLAFKAVYTLEVQRRISDKRVIALYSEYVVLD